MSATFYFTFYDYSHFSRYDSTRFFIRRWSEVDKEKSMKRRLEIIFFAAKASIINVRYRFKQLNFDFNFNLNTFEHLNINLNWKLCIDFESKQLNRSNIENTIQLLKLRLFLFFRDGFLMMISQVLRRPFLERRSN